jgi:hypothetical protein
MCAAVGAPGLHFHDLRHSGNLLAAASGALLRDLMNRMGHDSMRAALIYHHATQKADRKIAQALERLLGEHGGEDGVAEQDDDEPPDAPLGALANRTRIARRVQPSQNEEGPGQGKGLLTWAFGGERVTGIEPELSAWETSRPCGTTNDLRRSAPVTPPGTPFDTEAWCTRGARRDRQKRASCTTAETSWHTAGRRTGFGVGDRNMKSGEPSLAVTQE